MRIGTSSHSSETLYSDHPIQATAIKCNRSGNDRRKKITPLFFYHLRRGQRTSGRRQEDIGNNYIDIHSFRFLFITLSILTLSCLDATFTLQLIQQGAVEEANPVLRYFLDQGINQFLYVKIGITVAFLLFFITYKNILLNKKLINFLLNGTVTIYAMLVLYELALLAIV